MSILQAIILGIVQGLSEFLPISSSAHLVFTSNFYKVFKGIEIVDKRKYGRAYVLFLKKMNGKEE